MDLFGENTEEIKKVVTETIIRDNRRSYHSRCGSGYGASFLEEKCIRTKRQGIL